MGLLETCLGATVKTQTPHNFEAAVLKLCWVSGVSPSEHRCPSWINHLQEKLEIITDCAHVKNDEESMKRKKLLIKNKLFKPLTVNEKV